MARKTMRWNGWFAAVLALLGLSAHSSPDAGAFTVSGWIRPAAITDGQKEGLVWSWGNGWSNGFRLTLLRRAGGFAPSVHFAGRGGDEWFRLYSKRANGDTSFSLNYSRTLKPGERAHLATVFDGRQLVNYLNGVRVNEVDYAGKMIPASPARWTFKSSQFGTGAMEGELEGFKCRDGALSDEAIAKEVCADSGEWDRLPMYWRKAQAAAAAQKYREAEALYRKIGNPPALAEAELMRRLASGGPRPVAYQVKIPEPPEFGASSGPAVYVSVQGDDRADGSADRPLRTLTAARDRLRTLRGVSRQGGTVWIGGGEYAVTNTLELTEEDGGTDEAPVVWSAVPGARVTLSGWRQIPPSAFVPWKNGIVVADVRGYLGTEPLEPWGIGLSGGRKGVTDLYCRGRLLMPAQHPNEGFATICRADDAAKTFALDGIDANAWRDERHLMASGYWYWYWEDQTVPVSVTNGLFRIGDGYLAKQKRPADGRSVVLVNSLKALDAPGEWYLDSDEGRLYLLPPERSCDGIFLSQMTGPFVAAKDAANIVWRGMTMVGGRTSALDLAGRRLVVEDCRIGDFGCRAAAFKGEGNVFRRNRVKGCGGGAVVMKGRGFVDSNDISEVARRWRTYSPAVLADGRGTVVSRNEFHHMRSSAIRLEGHDHLVVSNDVHDCVLESDDQGAVDIWGNPGYSGIRILANRWTDVGRKGPRVPTGQAAVRLDDWVSRVQVAGNAFTRCGNGHFGAVQINKGRGNVIENNLFVDCHRDLTVLTAADDGWKKTVAKKCAKSSDYDVLLQLPDKTVFERNVMVNTRSSRTGGTGGNRVFGAGVQYSPGDAAFGCAGPCMLVK